jgi:SHS2 domain-containing protein
VTDAGVTPFSEVSPAPISPAGHDLAEHLPAAGHSLVLRTSDCVIEAWGPDAAACISEALAALVEEFAEVLDAPSNRVLPLAADPGGAEDALVALLEDVIYTVDVFSVVPVRFHLALSEGGAVAGDMEVVPVDQVVLVGPMPKAVSYHELAMSAGLDGWRCHVLIEV